MEKEQLRKLIQHIEQNLRASKVSGIEFIDPRDLKNRIQTKQNHIVFGRRGAGKSSLLSSIQEDSSYRTICVNLEDYKDISFPNILIKVLIQVFKDLQKEILPVKFNPLSWLGYKKKIGKRIKNYINELEDLEKKPDEDTMLVRTKQTRDTETTYTAKGEVGSNVGYASGNASGGIEHCGKDGSEKEIERKLTESKLDKIKRMIPQYKDTFFKCVKRPIFLVLDDFYFIPKPIQPSFIDYFHRLTKDTFLFVKVGTIKHRTKAYEQTEESYVGTELGHDIISIDMDYTFDHFDELQSFMEQLLKKAAEGAGAKIDFDELFKGEGFKQLCIASGGVPRDFFSLFIAVSDCLYQGKEIGKREVTNAAIANLNNKMSSMRSDSLEEKDILEKYLNYIKKFVYEEKRTNMFLVCKNDLEGFSQERQAIKELVDLRLVHLVDANTSSAPADGKRYEVYMIDLGLFENASPRSFTQREPGVFDDRSRKDNIRSAPKLDLQEMKDAMEQYRQQNNVDIHLEETG